MGWECPRCNTVHPYSIRKCPCGNLPSSHKKASKTVSIIILASLFCLATGLYFGFAFFKKRDMARQSMPSLSAIARIEATDQAEEQIRPLEQEEADILDGAVYDLKEESAGLAPKGAAIHIDNRLDDLAAYIAGVSDHTFSTIDGSLLHHAAWKQYCADMSDSWDAYDSTQAAPMRQWREKELQATDVNKTIFYPFSGPDILYAYAFFPKAETFLMIGLEPVGSLPDFTSDHEHTVPATYFNSIKKSLHAIVNFSFFRTESMGVDLRGKELDGTIHLILLFLKHTHNSIVDIKPVSIDNNGKLVGYDSFDEQARDTLMNRGVEVSFVDQDNAVLKKLYYFSLDLSDKMLTKNNGLVEFVENLGEFTTFVKSASYLMYKSQFSTVRNMILVQSQYVIQDDSGIPFKEFCKNNNWDITLYGSYITPIPLFSYYYQDDLKKAYSDKRNLKKLPFGVGYKHKLGESNLMLAQKKPLVAYDVRSQLQSPVKSQPKIPLAPIQQSVVPKRAETPQTGSQPKEVAAVKTVPHVSANTVAYPYSVYFGSVQSMDYAIRGLSAYESQGFLTYWSKVHLGAKGTWYRLFTGYFRSAQEAKAFIQQNGIKDGEVKETRYSNLIGTFATKKEKEDKALALAKMGLSAYFIPAGNGQFRLYSGGFITRDGAEQNQAELNSRGIKSEIVER
jgi:hypothetical protein